MLVSRDGVAAAAATEINATNAPHCPSLPITLRHDGGFTALGRRHLLFSICFFCVVLKYDYELLWLQFPNGEMAIAAG